MDRELVFPFKFGRTTTVTDALFAVLKQIERACYGADDQKDQINKLSKLVQQRLKDANQAPFDKREKQWYKAHVKFPHFDDEFIERIERERQHEKAEREMERASRKMRKSEIKKDLAVQLQQQAMDEFKEERKEVREKALKRKQFERFDRFRLFLPSPTDERACRMPLSVDRLLFSYPIKHLVSQLVLLLSCLV